MSRFIFKITKHSVTEVPMVAVYDGDFFIAAIYEADDKEDTIRIISKYYSGFKLTSEQRTQGLPPVADIELDLLQGLI